MFNTTSPVSGETWGVFGQITDQAFREFTASYEKQEEEGEKGKRFFGKKEKEQVGELAGCGDKHCRDTDQEKKGRDPDVDLLGTVRESGGHGIQRDRKEKEDQGRNKVRHEYSPYA